MPIFEYECENGHRYEMLQLIREKEPEKCKFCGGKLRKLISCPNLPKNAGIYLFDRSGRDLLHDK